jgi:hypothetical protein
MTRSDDSQRPQLAYLVQACKNPDKYATFVHMSPVNYADVRTDYVAKAKMSPLVAQLTALLPVTLTHHSHLIYLGGSI